MTDFQEKDYRWFIANYADLSARYGACYLVIHDCSVVESYQSCGDAFRDAMKYFGAGNFIIQECNGTATIPVCEIYTPFITLGC